MNTEKSRSPFMLRIDIVKYRNIISNLILNFIHEKKDKQLDSMNDINMF